MAHEEEQGGPVEADDAQELEAPTSLPARGRAGEGALEAGPVKELARAFQANAAALQSINEIQADLARALRRGDRSELVLQSTQALNDTFRNLTSIQRQLLGRLGETSGRGSGGRLVPMMLLGLLVVFLGGLYAVIVVIQENAGPGSGIDPMQVAAARLESFQEGTRKGAADADAEIARIKNNLDQTEARVRTLQVDHDKAQSELTALERARVATEAERDELAERAMELRNEAMARKLVEERLHELEAQQIAAERRLEQTEFDLARARRQNEFLSKRMAAYGLGLPDEPESYGIAPAPTEDAPVVPPPPPSARPDRTPGSLPAPREPTDAAATRPAPAPAAAAAPASAAGPRVPSAFPPAQPPPPGPSVPAALTRVDKDLNRDPAIAERIRTAVNRLLEAGVGPAGTSWQVTRIGGFTQDRLADVILLQYDGSGRMLASMEAREMRIYEDLPGRSVEFHLKDGKRIVGGRALGIPDEGIRFQVASQDDLVRAWHNSGLSMVLSR